MKRFFVLAINLISYIMTMATLITVDRYCCLCEEWDVPVYCHHQGFTLSDKARLLILPRSGCFRLVV